MYGFIEAVLRFSVGFMYSGMNIRIPQTMEKISMPMNLRFPRFAFTMTGVVCVCGVCEQYVSVWCVCVCV